MMQPFAMHATLICAAAVAFPACGLAYSHVMYSFILSDAPGKKKNKKTKGEARRITSSLHSDKNVSKSYKRNRTPAK